MVADVNGFSLDLSQVISIKLETTDYDDEMDKVIFTLRPIPQYVWNPKYEEWEFVNEPTTIVRKFTSTSSARSHYKFWIEEWNGYTNKLEDIKSEKE